MFFLSFLLAKNDPHKSGGSISYAEPLTFSIHQKAEMDRLVKEELQYALWVAAKTWAGSVVAHQAILDLRKMFLWSLTPGLSANRTLLP